MSPMIENMDRLVRDVPAMPAVAQRVMQMLGDPRTTNTVLGETLAADMSLASRLLQMANSPFFGARQKISSISQAIFVLGHAALRSLIITVCTKGIFKNPGLMEEKIWEHSLGAGAAAKALAKNSGLADPDEAFLGGLLHDIGRCILITMYRDAYQPIFQQAYNEDITMQACLDLEKEEFGYHHAEIGSRVITAWKLPASYARAARKHHTENIEALQKEENANLIAIVAQANLLALKLGLGRHEPDQNLQVVDTPYCKMLGIQKESILKSAEQTLKNYKEFKEQFTL